MLNQSAPVSLIYSVTNLLWSDTFTGVTSSGLYVLYEIVLSHYPRKKWFVLFWMCEFIALTRCCKLDKFFNLIFAVLLPNLIKDARPAGLPAMGSEKHGVQGSTPVSEGCDLYHPLLLPLLSEGLLPVNANWPQPDTSHNWLTLAAELGEDSRRPNLSLA